MPPKRSIWIPLVWAFSILGLILLVWSSGFLYWHLRIASELSRMRREAAPPLAKDAFPTFLPQAGSRAIPKLLQGTKHAIQEENREAATLLYRSLLVVRMAAEGGESYEMDKVVWEITARTHSLDALRQGFAIEESAWYRERRQYTPWWMWWNGKRIDPPAK